MYTMEAGLIALACSLGYFLLWFFIAIYKKRIDLVDIAWGGAFTAMAIGLLIKNQGEVSFAQSLVTLLVCLWGLRITIHIFQRNWSADEDQRYIELRKKWKGPVWLNSLFRIYALQAVLATMIAFPVIAIASSDTLFHAEKVLTLGFAIWITGFMVEVFADRQLADFLKNKKSKKIMDQGLWRYSRHPNYFGEVTLWWGIWVISLSVNGAWWSIIGPLTITYLILFVSGVSLTEKRYATNKQFQAYKKRTSIFVPLPPKKATK